MPDNRTTRTYLPNSDDEQQWQELIINRARRTQERAQAENSVRYSSETPQKGDKRTTERSPAWIQCIAAARWIPRLYDMYCNLEEAIWVFSIVDAAENDTDDEVDNEASARIQAAYKSIVESLDVSTILRHQSVYHYLEDHAPYLMDLIRKKDHEKRAVLIRKMQAVINRTRSDDASHLRPFIGSYAAPHPEKKLINPPVQPRGTKDKLGFNHPELARLLCPIRHLTKKRILSGEIKVTTQKNPAFLYEGDVPGEHFDPQDTVSGFMHGFLVERVMKHIFTLPSSVFPNSKTQNTRASNSKLHKMKFVEANHIAYTATHARFSICFQTKFVDVDGLFKLPEFYYRLATFIGDDSDSEWSSALCAHYNKALFGNPRGLGCAVEDNDNEPSDEDDIAIMKKQLAGRRGSAHPAGPGSIEDHAMARYDDDDDDMNGLYDNDYDPTPSPFRPAPDSQGDEVNPESDSGTESTPPPVTIAPNHKARKTSNVHTSRPMSPHGGTVAAHFTDASQNTSISRNHAVIQENTRRTSTVIGSSTASLAPANINRTSTAHVSREKAKVVENEDKNDSPLTDIDENANIGKKRKKGTKATAAPVRKSTHARK